MRPRAFPIRDGVVDRVLSVNALQYLSDPTPVYREIKRVLKPGGHLFVADWRRSGLDFAGIQSQAVFADQARSDIAKAGLRGTEVLEQQPNFWIIRARKDG